MDVHQGVEQADPLAPEVEQDCVLVGRLAPELGDLKLLVHHRDPVLEQLRHAGGLAIDDAGVGIVGVEHRLEGH